MLQKIIKQVFIVVRELWIGAGYTNSFWLLAFLPPSKFITNLNVTNS